MGRRCHLAVGLLALTACGAPAPSGTQRLEAARFRLDDAAEPPSAEGTPVALPHLWAETHPSAEGSGWYRFELDLPAVPTAAQGILLSKLNMNAAVWLNGVWVGDGGSFEPPVAQNWNRPLYFATAPDLWRAGTNRLEVRVYAYAYDWGGLFPVRVGPDAALRPLAERQRLLQVLPSRMASLGILALAITLAALAAGSREPAYGYWAASSFAFFVHSLSAHVVDIGVPFPTGRWLVHVCFDAFALLNTFGIHRWTGRRRPRLEAGLLGLFALSAVASGLAPASAFYPAANFGHLCAFGVGLYASALLFAHLRELGGAESAFTVMAGTLVLALGAHDLAVYFGLLPQDTPRLLKLMVPAVGLGFGAILVARYIQNARRVAGLNVELERRIAAREAELARSYARTRDLEHERLLERERSRLMREMHDGMGGRLVGLLAMVQERGAEPERIAEELRRALDELRFVIDSLDPGVHELGSLLGLVRERLEPRLVGQGMRLEWRVAHLPEVALGPQQSLDLLRCLQECLTNILKHARARTVSVATEVGPDRLLLRVSDDGRGMQAPSEGRGLRNLKDRAERLGGRLEVGPNPGAESGTRVTLSLPWPL